MATPQQTRKPSVQQFTLKKTVGDRAAEYANGKRLFLDAIKAAFYTRDKDRPIYYEEIQTVPDEVKNQTGELLRQTLLRIEDISCHLDVTPDMLRETIETVAVSAFDKEEDQNHAQQMVAGHLMLAVSTIARQNETYPGVEVSAPAQIARNL